MADVAPKPGAAVVLSSSASQPSQPVPRPTDPKFILQTLASNGLTLKDPTNPKLFTTAGDLEEGTISHAQFIQTCAPLICPIFGVDNNILQLTDALQGLAGQIREEAETDVLKERYLGVFETAKGLEPQSVRIVAAVKEVLGDAFDDHEVAYLQADSASIRDFLREETIPFLKEVESRGMENVPLSLIRRKRAELKEKLELLRKNTNVHLQRVEKSTENITNGPYYIKTNHLPHYAAAASLEILVRGYYVLLGRLDADDIMVDTDATTTISLAKERIDMIQTLLKRYKDARLALVTDRGE